jgi:hypothetical protein
MFNSEIRQIFMQIIQLFSTFRTYDNDDDTHEEENVILLSILKDINKIMSLRILDKINDIKNI